MIQWNYVNKKFVYIGNKQWIQLINVLGTLIFPPDAKQIFITLYNEFCIVLYSLRSSQVTSNCTLLKPNAFTVETCNVFGHRLWGEAKKKTQSENTDAL